MSNISGHVSHGFGAVADAFEAAFSSRRELGAALCVYHRGSKVIDIWGGVRDALTGAPWMEDTIVPVFSVSKGIVAIACLSAVSAGHISLDDRIARHWPDFGRDGKVEITIRDILDHKAGLVLFGRPVDRVDLSNSKTMESIVEAMRPVWKPGTAWGYHLATFGILLAQVIRRTDPKSRSFADAFSDDIARPLGLSFYFGLPDAISPERWARVRLPSLVEITRSLWEAPFGLKGRVLNPAGLLHRTMREVRDISMNDPTWLRNEFPSVNGIGDARSIAELYSQLSLDRNRIGIRQELLMEISGLPSIPVQGDQDRVMGIPARWHMGFLRPSAIFPFSPSPRAFGMPGLGGAFAFYDPDHDLAYAYTPNGISALPFNDEREVVLRRAVFSALGTRGAPSGTA